MKKSQVGKTDDEGGGKKRRDVSRVSSLPFVCSGFLSLPLQFFSLQAEPAQFSEALAAFHWDCII